MIVRPRISNGRASISIVSTLETFPDKFISSADAYSSNKYALTNEATVVFPAQRLAGGKVSFPAIRRPHTQK